MSATVKHLVRASRFHLIVDKDVRAKEHVADCIDTCQEAFDALTQNLALVAGLHQLEGQSATDFMSDYIGTVSNIAPLQQSDFPALLKAALVANHKKG